MTRIIYLSALVALFLIGLKIAPAQKSLVEQAGMAMRDLQFREAIADYLKALEQEKEGTLKHQQIIHALADCYRIINNKTEAAVWYAKLAETTYAERMPKIYLDYADVLKTQEKYQQAETYYQRYLKKRPADQLGKSGLQSCQLFQDTSQLRTRWMVGTLSGLNSSQDEYAAWPAQNNNQLYFSSNRPGTVGEGVDNWTGHSFSDLMMSDKSPEGWSSPVTAESGRLVNTPAHEGTPVLNSTSEFMYFTRCERGSEKKVYCQVMKSEWKDGKWSRPVTIYAENMANIGHPWVSPDELVMYFASDRRGGAGGKDIWMLTRQNKSLPFRGPVNLGRVVNTPGDEMFPFVKDDTLLYFASNGHPGLGGLDHFRSVRRNKNWSTPENLLLPLNSPGDDFGMVFDTPTTGYFSSNRSGGQGGDDIYWFERKAVKLTLSGTVKDVQTMKEVPGITITLVPMGGDSIRTISSERGKYHFDSTWLREDSNYRVVISGQNFLTLTDSLETMDYATDTDIIRDYLVQPIQETPIVLPDILYDLDRWDIKPQYRDSLENLVRILTDNPTLIIELRSHTDSRASDQYNDELSQKRAQSVVDYLIGQGINKNKLVAKGFGERVPRTLEKDIIRGGFLFPKGTLLNEEYINQLPSNDLKEAAHSLNRRTEFLIIGR